MLHCDCCRTIATSVATTAQYEAGTRMIDWLVIGAALMSGLLGGVHCAAMCGGIATGLSFGLRPASPGAQWLQALQPNLGRVLGYTLAGAIVSLLPMVTLFVLAQKFFVRGITMSGIKG